MRGVVVAMSLAMVLVACSASEPRSAPDATYAPKANRAHLAAEFNRLMHHDSILDLPVDGGHRYGQLWVKAVPSNQIGEGSNAEATISWSLDTPRADFLAEAMRAARARGADFRRVECSATSVRLVGTKTVSNDASEEVFLTVESEAGSQAMTIMLLGQILLPPSKAENAGTRPTPEPNCPGAVVSEVDAAYN